MHGKIIAVPITNTWPAVAAFDFYGEFTDTLQLAKNDSQWRLVNQFLIDQ